MDEHVIHLYSLHFGLPATAKRRSDRQVKSRESTLCQRPATCHEFECPGQGRCGTCRCRPLWEGLTLTSTVSTGVGVAQEAQEASLGTGREKEDAVGGQRFSAAKLRGDRSSSCGGHRGVTAGAQGVEVPGAFSHLNVAFNPTWSYRCL